MGEALLIKAGVAEERNPLDDVAVTAGYCTILALVKDSGGNRLPNIPINCNDGGRWYNYTTNENGMALFMTNSGSANITTYNWSVLDAYNMIDQEAPPIMNIDAPVGTKKMANFQFNLISNIEINTNKTWRYLDTKQIFAQLVGGGGGGARCCGGGGGAYNEGYIMIDRATKYNIIVGAGGAGNSLWIAGTGGTTSAFGLSAVGGTGCTGYYGSNDNLNPNYSISNKPGIGGGSGNFKGGDGGARYQNGSPSAYANSSFNYGGGGAGGGTVTNSTENIYVNARINGVWYNNLIAYYWHTPNVGNNRYLRNVIVSNVAYGRNGGANGTSTRIDTTTTFYFYLPNGTWYNNLTGGSAWSRINTIIATPSSPTGYGGGGGGGTSEYRIGTSGSSGYKGAVFTTRIE